MKEIVRFSLSVAVAVSAFCGIAAPTVSYKTATNIAEYVVETYMGNIKATNIINNITRTNNAAILVNVSDEGVNPIVTIGQVNKQSNLAGLMTPDDKTKLDNLDTTVNSHERFMFGSNVVFSVTNYQSGAYSTKHGKMRIEELRDGEYREIYDSRKEILVHITNETEKIRADINRDIGASNRTYLAALEGKADRAWGKYTSSGADAPEENHVYMTAPHTVFGGGYEFERVNVNEGAVWVLTDKGAPVYTTGEEGVFKFQDLGGTNYFGFAKSDSYTLGCDTDGIRVYNGVVELTYNLTGAIPIVYYKATLTGAGDWEPLNDASGNPVEGASVSVVWDESPPEGTQVCTIATDARPSGFFMAQISMSGGSKFFTNMEADFQGGITCTNTALGVTGIIYPVFNGTAVEWQWRAR